MISKSHILCAAIASGLAIASPVQAQTSPVNTGAAAPEQAAPQKEKLICRTEGVIGSRAKKRRVCLTKAEWEQVARQGNAYAYTIVESGRAGRMDSN